MELVGRDRELAVLARAVADVRAGSGRVLSVSGEAGIGKTALLSAIAQRARAEGLQVLEGRAAEHERDVPFGVVVDALDEHVASMAAPRVATLGQDLGAVLPAAAWHTGAPVTTGAGAAERFRYHRAVRALLELLGRERPVAVLLDDIHWADAASVELVLHLLRRPPAVAHLLVFASRPIGPLSRLLDAARRAPGFAQLTLEPLGRDASLELLAGVPERAVRERVAQEARGNPLFLRELARVADRRGAELPRTLLAAVGLELSALAPGSRALIEARPWPAIRSTRNSRRPPPGCSRTPPGSTAWSRPAWCGRPATLDRSRSAIRWCGGPSMTPRHRLGGSPPTSGRRPRSSAAAPAQRRVPITSLGSRVRVTSRRSRSSRRPPRTPLAARPPPPRTGTRRRRRCCHTPLPGAGRDCWRRWRSRWQAPDGCPRRMRRSSTRSSCSDRHPARTGSTS